MVDDGGHHPGSRLRRQLAAGVLAALMATSDLVGPCVIHNTVCSLLLRESKIYREIEVVNMWWTTIIVVALLAFGIVGFVSMVRLFEQRLTSETTRRAEDMYDQYADSPRQRHRRLRCRMPPWPFSLNRVPDSSLRFAARIRAWPLAWPLPSGPLGWQRSPGSTARRRCVPRSGMRRTGGAGGGRRPVTGDAKRGSRRAVEQRRDPVPEARPPLAGHPGRSSPRLLAPVRALHGRGASGSARRRCALEVVGKLSQLYGDPLGPRRQDRRGDRRARHHPGRRRDQHHRHRGPDR